MLRGLWRNGGPVWEACGPTAVLKSDITEDGLQPPGSRSLLDSTLERGGPKPYAANVRSGT
jgi:hypothetical protein